MPCSIATGRSWPNCFRSGPSFRGDHRYGDRLTDASVAGQARQFDFWRGVLADLDRIDTRQLGREDQVSSPCCDGAARTCSPSSPMSGRSMTVNSASISFHSFFTNMLLGTPVTNEAQVEQLLARMAAYPRRIDEEIANLRRGMAAGWVPSQPVLREVLRQLDHQLAEPVDKSVYLPAVHAARQCDSGADAGVLEAARCATRRAGHAAGGAAAARIRRQRVPCRRARRGRPVTLPARRRGLRAATCGRTRPPRSRPSRSTRSDSSMSSACSARWTLRGATRSSTATCARSSAT